MAGFLRFVPQVLGRLPFVPDFWYEHLLFFLVNIIVWKFPVLLQSPKINKRLFYNLEFKPMGQLDLLFGIKINRPLERIYNELAEHIHDNPGVPPLTSDLRVQCE